ncbi:hypothetical protein DWB84_13215 [Saccharophagus sp. K07]|jgi:hypothetical protein|uniref:hypothetical protein n=1 Tax=Saccharophagus sp. K07 TaxID=2283636 RepID=UPI0016520B75|nr:hypothetical protein [Saccharophagus sp. K07]MBC6906416.1 hypothetical protein [Saccharophagus sp. K07]
MNTAPQNVSGIDSHDTSILKQQLVREITCLERQLERIRMREDFATDATLQTYEEMIESRRKMLYNLPWE